VFLAVQLLLRQSVTAGTSPKRLLSDSASTIAVIRVTGPWTRTAASLSVSCLASLGR
jgi:hypothetical protein